MKKSRVNLNLIFSYIFWKKVLLKKIDGKKLLTHPIYTRNRTRYVLFFSRKKNRKRRPDRSSLGVNPPLWRHCTLVFARFFTILSRIEFISARSHRWNWTCPRQRRRGFFWKSNASSSISTRSRQILTREKKKLKYFIIFLNFTTSTIKQT